MKERIVKLEDLSEFEQKSLRQQAEDDTDQRVRMQGDDKVVIRDETEAELDDLDPREGVEVQGVRMTDEVANILEQPFQQPEDREDREARSDPKAEEEKPFEPDPADVRNFVRCMLGNKRFTKEYSAYGGALKFTLGARTHMQDEDVVFSCANMNPVRALAHMTNLRLAYSLINIQIGDQHTGFRSIVPSEMVPVEPSGGGDLVDQAQEAQATILATEARISEIGQYPQTIYGVLSSSMREFDMLVTVLAQRANDPKHWATDSAD